MKVFPIKSPLDGEQVVGVAPQMDSFVERDWRRRVNHFTGRALTHTALRSEQAGRSGRVAALGQMLSPGVVNGLIVDQSNSASGSDQQFLDISVGHGIDGNGEIARVNAPLRVDLKQIPVHAPVALLEGDTHTGEAGTSLVRKFGPSLETAISTGLTLPRVAILVLQPVQVEMNLQAEDDPCELDPDAYAYENWQLIDGTRLVLYSWPDEIISLPGTPADVDWRNKIANSIFNYEKNLTANEYLPWMSLGVPLALIGFDESWQSLFVDRHAVVRQGGKRRRSPSVLTEIGNRFLWQARFTQFNENLVDSLSTLVEDETLVFEAARRFRYLPPVGVLPKDFIDLEAGKHQFFPLSYHVEAAVVPYEQLELIVQDSAGLAAFDFNRADRVQTLVPVPQIYYEPDLLKTEIVDPEFDLTILGFIIGRNDWLGRRLEVRRKTNTVNKAISGVSTDYPFPDINSVDASEIATPFEVALVEQGDLWRYLKGDIAPPADWFSTAFDESSWLSGRSGLGFKLASVETEIDDMPGSYTSIFLRRHFNLEAVDAARGYRLEVLTNGGFYAYLNGVEIMSHNLSSKAFDATADKSFDAEVSYFDLDELPDTLVAGDNVISFQVHTSDLAVDSFVFSPRLIEKQYVTDIESESYGLVVKEEAGEVVLEDGEPEYSIDAVQDLQEFFNSRTYLAADGTNKRIWNTEEISRFEKIESEGLREFIDFFQSTVGKANDKVDFGFGRLHTDIYRVRQFILGNEDATKLAISPIFADIAKGQSAVATKEDISRAVSLLSASVPVGASVSPASGPVGATLIGGGDLTARSGNLDGFDFSDQIIDIEGSGKTVISGDKTTQVKTETVSDGKFFGDLSGTVKQIEEQSSLIGSFPTFRSVTVGERLKKAITEDAIEAGRANRIEAIVNIKNSGLSMDGIRVPGIRTDGGDEELLFGDIKDSHFDAIKKGIGEPPGADNESSKFNNTIFNLEHSTALLRLTEARIKTYRLMIDRCNKTLNLLEQKRVNMDRRLKVIEDELAEARHDVSVSRALKAEELERIEEINARRRTVLEEQVPFLVFRRPRLSDALLNTPVYELFPDLSQAPFPVCDIEEDETPEEIAAMMEVIKEAPVKWFKVAERVMKPINRLPDLRVMLKAAQLKASRKTTLHRLLVTKYSGLNKLAAGINKTLLASHSLIMLQRRKTAAISLASFARYGWQESRKRAAEVISLGDIIDGSHGRTGASKIAAEELEQVSRIAVCLYHHFADVLPSIRLDWAERLSQFDAPFKLRNLYSLPRWGEIDFIERSEMQKLVDWLYGRIESSFPDAENMISELVRVSILLASHAPVNQIISGLIPEPVTVKVGSKINIVANLSRIRIGMNIAMLAGQKTVARGRVADIVGGQVQAQIVSTTTTSVLLEKNAKVQIGEPRATGGAVYRKNRFLFKR